ncbi:MAG: DEAD/DEAH box helicase [Acidobacteriaceae bacterium]|nr:DEAD/DEAH box helicase [Acidobacteriaceae bacterium]
MHQFSELSLSATLHKNLERNCFVQPTPVQAQAIPPALTGADVVATAQTGTGKTLAFLLPIVEKLQKSTSKNVRALVLSPTRELAIQIADTFQKLAPGTGLRHAIVVGGLSENTQLNALRKGVDIVIATPGRLEDFLNRRLINLSSVETLVLDEADRMLDMGFLPAIERILSVLPATRQSLFFSATMEKAVERLIDRHSKSPVRIAIGSAERKAPEQIDLHVYEVEHERKFALLRHLLQKEEGLFLVFSRTKHGADRLSKRLSASGTKAVAMHGDRTQNQRNQALAGFRDGRYRVLVATDVAARGIHVDSVAHVVNYDLPQAPEDFIHRVGRTGRAGQRGAASTFTGKHERSEIRRIERECKLRLERREISPEILEEIHISEQEAIKLSRPASLEETHPPHQPHHRNHTGNPKSQSMFKGRKRFPGKRKFANKAR